MHFHKTLLGTISNSWASCLDFHFVSVLFTEQFFGDQHKMKSFYKMLDQNKTHLMLVFIARAKKYNFIHNLTLHLEMNGQKVDNKWTRTWRYHWMVIQSDWFRPHFRFVSRAWTKKIFHQIFLNRFCFFNIFVTWWFSCDVINEFLDIYDDFVPDKFVGHWEIAEAG